MAAKAYIGPASPTIGRTNSGANVGPTTVPSPCAEASIDMACVRCSALVRSAT